MNVLGDRHGSIYLAFLDSVMCRLGDSPVYWPKKTTVFENTLNILSLYNLGGMPHAKKTDSVPNDRIND